MPTDVSVIGTKHEPIWRTFWKIVAIKHSRNNWYLTKGDRRRRCPEEEAQLISSLCTNGLHAPALDLDMPATLVPSTTPGHFHLYIDYQMSWRKYKRLLRALRSSGLIDKGFYKICMRQKKSMLLKPGMTKGLYDDMIEEERLLNYP